MKCRICGAKLRKEGDICKSCYEEYCKEEALEKDVNEIYKVKGKYVLAFQLIKYFDWILVTLLVVIAVLAQAQILLGVFFLLLALFCLSIVLSFEKRKAKNTTCTFYDKKVVWQYKDRKKTLAYSDIKNVTYYQGFFQKLFKLADVQFHPDGGTYLIGGFELKNVPEIDSEWEKIEEIIISKREN